MQVTVRPSGHGAMSSRAATSVNRRAQARRDAGADVLRVDARLDDDGQLERHRHDDVARDDEPFAEHPAVGEQAPDRVEVRRPGAARRSSRRRCGMTTRVRVPSIRRSGTSGWNPSSTSARATANPGSSRAAARELVVGQQGVRSVAVRGRRQQVGEVGAAPRRRRSGRWSWRTPARRGQRRDVPAEARAHADAVAERPRDRPARIAAPAPGSGR